VRLLKYLISLQEKREGEGSLVEEKILGKEKVIAISTKV
jgi:hypothetical protein